MLRSFRTDKTLRLTIVSVSVLFTFDSTKYILQKANQNKKYKIFTDKDCIFYYRINV